MSFDISKYRKTIVAVIGGLVAVGAAISGAVADDEVTFAEIGVIVAAVGTALGVYQVPNRTDDDAE